MKKEKRIINKIEVDKNNEPVIVSISDQKVNPPETDYAEISEKIKNENASVELSSIQNFRSEHKEFKKELRKQLFMTQVLGIEKDKNIDRRKRVYKNVFSLCFILIALAVIVYTAFNDLFGREEKFSWQVIFDTIGNNAHFFVLALVALFFCFFFKALNLSIMSKALTKRFKLTTCFETAIVEHYYNNVTPLAVGGQTFAIMHLTRHGYDAGTSTSMAISTFFMHQLGFVVLGVFTLISLSPSINLFNLPSGSFDSLGVGLIKSAAIIGLSFCMTMPVLVLLFTIFPRVCSKLVSLVLHIAGKLKLVKNPKLTTYKTLKAVVHNAKCLKKIGKNPFVLILAFIVSLLEQFASCAIAYFVLCFFGYSWTQTPIISFLQITQICTLVSAAVSFIPTPGNTGAADLTFYEIFKSGLAKGLAFPAMLIWRILSYYSFLIIGFIFTILKRKSDRKKQAKGIALD